MEKKILEEVVKKFFEVGLLFYILLYIMFKFCYCKNEVYFFELLEKQFFFFQVIINGNKYQVGF